MLKTKTSTESYAAHYIIDDRQKPVKFNKFQKSTQRPVNTNQPSAVSDPWRVPDDPMAADFFDNFKGKSDQSQVTQFINEKKNNL